MGDIHAFAGSAIVLPLAEYRMIADTITGLHQAISMLSGLLIDRLDASQPDPDLEDGGDRECGDGDDRDIAWPEWDRRDARTKRSGVSMLSAVGGTFGMTEDDEEDDPSGVCDEDGVNTEYATVRGSGPGCLISDQDLCQDDMGEDEVSDRTFPDYALDQSQGPLPLALANDPEIAADHRDRIRRERCKSKVNHWGEPAWYFKPEPLDISAFDGGNLKEI